jgi:hypothetical protein
VEKGLGPFDVWKVHAGQKTCKNRQICFAMLTKCEGIVLKIPEFNRKYV